MVQLCSRCQRANPDAAIFCWFDGVVLQQGATPPQLTLPREFSFPSGRRCRTYEELVQGCQQEWATARVLLRSGTLGAYLAGIGRHDLAHAAAESSGAPDPDIALHQFIAQLPATLVQGPRLELSPRRLVVERLRPGEQRQVTLTLANQGKGVLQGKVAVSDGGAWLRTTDGSGEVAVKTERTQQITLQIDGRGLTASQGYTAKLTVVTNGGVAEVPVGLEVGAMPFSRAPFAGVASPREMAEKMKASPKQAVPILESGEVSQWFRANGWAYPVVGPTARGVAAVQQFFEGMGLSKPPPLLLSQNQVQAVCVGPEPIQGAVILYTSAKKWVYAQADSDVRWLRVVPNVSGPQQAQLVYQIDPSALDSGKVYNGTIQLTANAGQKLVIPVQVAVRQPQQSAVRKWLRPVLVGAAAALLLRLLLALPADLFARAIAGPPASDTAPVEVATWFYPPGGSFLRHFILVTWWLGAVMGALLAWHASQQPDKDTPGPGRKVRGATSGLSDLFWGIIAGAFAGLLGGATLGCLLLLCDAPAMFLLNAMVASGGPSPNPWRWLPLWVVMTAALWSALGGGLGAVLGALGRGGKQALTALAAPLIWMLRLFGLEGAAAFCEVSR
jgi:hypothetical protein